METWQEFVSQNWSDLALPVAVFLVSLGAALWLRTVAYRGLGRWQERGGGEVVATIIATTRGGSWLWALLLGLFMANHLSPVLSEWRTPMDRSIGSLLVISVALIALRLGQRLLRTYLGRGDVPPALLPWVVNSLRVGVAFAGALLLLDIWGVSTTPVILVLAAGVLAAALALRNAVPNLLAGFRLTSRPAFQVGEFIKLDSGEEGYVTGITWDTTHIRGLDNSVIIIPNNKLLKSTVINYGRPLKLAKNPFRFQTHHHLHQLTGLRAATLRELVDALKVVPGSVVYYHTHHFIEEHHFLSPEPANDFSLWVSEELGDEVLGEKLASIDTFAFPTIRALRNRLVEVMEGHLAQAPDGRRAPPGRELYFVSAITFILPTPYVARDLREFVEALRQVSTSSLYFHVFEARLRLQRGENDFSIWIEDSLGDGELGEEIATLDPYTYTLEGLRSAIIHMVEARL